MTHIRNRFDIQNAIEDETFSLKKLPNFFDFNDEISPLKGFSASVGVHIILIVLAFCFQQFVLSHLPKPELPIRDVEFKLVENESHPPINKNTKNRSDRDSRAGGKHDSKKPVSDPGRESKQKKSIPEKAPAKKAESKQPQKPLQKVFKPQQKQNVPDKTPVKQTAAPTPKKPSAVQAPSASKPSLKPAVKPTGITAPTAPKIATTPKSPFVTPVPASKAPVGNTYKPQGVAGGTSGTSSAGTAGVPAPKFSSAGVNSSGGASTGGSRSGSSGSYASRGSGGGNGSGNNPGAGNPNGAPGIDAIKQPNWGPYMRDLEQRIKRNWYPPKGDSSKRVVITFTIGRDGRLLSRKVTKSSGVPMADQAALHAVESTAPFRPLPPEFKGQSVPIEFTFDYNVLNSVLR